MRGLVSHERFTGILAGSKSRWLIAAVIYFLISWFYMGSAITHCSTTTTAFNSDSSGGLAWFQWASGNRLSWGSTDKSNYPIGENLQRPQFVTSAALDIPFRAFSRLTTPICGLNLIVFSGYMSAALVMFGLIFWLFKRLGIAYFAGYAAAFLPFHQIKSQSHIVYMFSGIFIAIVWAFLWYLQRPSYKKISILAVLSALAFYFDGYFVLFTGALATILLASPYVYGLWRLKFGSAKTRKSLKKYLLAYSKHIAYFVVILLVLLSPIVYTQKRYGSEIHQTLSAGRGNIKADAFTYGARPAEFLLPAFNNALAPSSYQSWRLSHQHFSNVSENTLYVGSTVVALSIISLLSLRYRKLRKTELLRPISYPYLIAMIGVTLIVSLLLSMPSRLNILGHYIPMPADLLIKLTSNWRVFSRFILVIDPLWVILAAAGLYSIYKTRQYKTYLIILTVCFVAIFGDFLATPVRASGDLYKDSPKIYKKIRDDKSVKIMAEYPLTDLVDLPSIFTFQQIHGKALVNANDSAIDRDAFHTSIGGLNDKQSLGALKELGVDVITSFGFNDDQNPSLMAYSPPDPSGRGGVPTIYSYNLTPSVVARKSVLTASSGFNLFSVDTKEISHRVLLARGSLQALNVRSRKLDTSQHQAFLNAQSIVGKNAQLIIKERGAILWQGVIGTTTRQVEFAMAGGSVELTTTVPIDITNMAVD